MNAQREYTIQFNQLISYRGESKEIIIPEGVTTIGRRAFYNNQKIEAVTLPKSVNIVEQEAFSYCPNLKSIMILGKIKKAGKTAFGHLSQNAELEYAICSAVSIRAFTKNDQDMVLGVFSRRFCEFDPSTEVYQDNLCFIGTHLQQQQNFANKLFFHYLIENDSLRQAVLEATAIPVKELDWLFAEKIVEENVRITAELLEYKNHLLSDKHIGKTVKKKALEKEIAFSNEISVADWRKLLKFSYEDGDIVIKEVKIKDPVIKLPAYIGTRRVRVLDSRAFSFNLKKGERQLWSPDKIILPEGIEEIRSAAFYCCKDTDIFFPETLKALPSDCFCAVKNLTLHIPASVTQIAEKLEYDSDKPVFKAIYAPVGSCAEQYAKKNNIPFVEE